MPEMQACADLIVCGRCDRLYATRNGQETPIRPMLTDHHQADRRAPWWLDRQSDGTAIEKVDDRRVP
jgi:hypothetical protein